MFIEYGKLSTQVYEITKPVGTSLNGDLEFYLEKLRPLSGKILEAGVGTGRLLIPFLKQGLSVVRVDISPYMLQACRSNLQQHGVDAPLYEQNLLTLDLPYKMEAIIMPTGSFALLPDRASAITVLENFKNHLTENGRLMIDLELPNDFILGESTTTAFPLSSQAGILFTSTALHMDWAKQRTVTLHRYEKWVEGKLVESELSRFVLCWYGIEEFSMMLRDIGYQNIQVVYDYGKHSSYQNIATFIATV